MAKYMFQASYTTEGMQGLMKDKASGRLSAVKTALKAVGGKLESFYYAFGACDVVLIVDLPDNTAAAAVSMVTASTGAVKISTTPLLTVAEVDKAIGLKSNYKAPGAGK